MTFPKIDSPCPVRWNAMPSAGRDFCTLCERRVHNLDAMTAEARRAFVAGCSGSVCVAYTVHRRRVPAAAGIGLAAALVLAPVLASASDAPAMLQSPVEQADPLGLDAKPVADCTDDEDTELVEIVVGGVRDAGAAQWVDADAIEAPELPAIGEDEWFDGMAEFVAEPAGM